MIKQSSPASMVLSPEPKIFLQRVKPHWPLAMKNRARILRSGQLPAYLLLPEIDTLLNDIEDERFRLLVMVIWYTGVRVSEALALTPAALTRDEDQILLTVRTLKRRGRPKTNIYGDVHPRVVPIRHPHFLRAWQRYVKTHRIKKNERLFGFTRQHADRVFKRWLVSIAQQHRWRLPPKVSLKSLRHSFAINCVLHGIPIDRIQGYLGHASVLTTMLYARVLPEDTGHLLALAAFSLYDDVL